MNECRVEVEVRTGRKSLTYGLRINGAEIPNVKKATAIYEAGNVRSVLIELYPTDFVEIDRVAPQTGSTGGTVGSPEGGLMEVVNGQDQEATGPGQD